MVHLAEKSRTKCVIFLIGEPSFGNALKNEPWVRGTMENLPERDFEIVVSSQGSQDDRARMRLADIVLLGSENRSILQTHAIFEAGMAHALEKPIYLFSKGTVIHAGLQGGFFKRASVSLLDTIEMIKVDAADILTRKKRAARNT